MDDLEAQLAKYGEALERAAADDRVVELARHRRQRCVRWLAAAAALLVVAGGLAIATRDNPSQVRTAGYDEPRDRRQPDVAEFARLVLAGRGTGGGPGVPNATPAENAASAELVVTGTIERFQAGRTLTGYGLEPFPVMVLRVDQVIDGVLPRDAGDQIYVELFMGQSSPEELARVAPFGRMALYLVSAPSGRVEQGPEMDEPDAGRPEGQPLWMPLYERSWFVEQDEGVVDLLDMTSHLGSALPAFIPPATAWPPPPSPPPLDCTDGRGETGGSMTPGIDATGRVTGAQPTVVQALQSFVASGPVHFPAVDQMVLSRGREAPAAGYALGLGYVEYRLDDLRAVAWVQVSGLGAQWYVTAFGACNGWYSSLPADPWPS